jgi:hypothetical protein
MCVKRVLPAPYEPKASLFDGRRQNGTAKANMRALVAAATMFVFAARFGRRRPRLTERPSGGRKCPLK